MNRFFRISAVCLALIAGTALSGWSQSDAETAQTNASDYFSEYPGIYSGTYICAAGENGMTISFDRFEDIHAANWPPTAEIEARLWFYDVASNPGHPSGAFHLTGLYRNGELELEPGDWIQRPQQSWGAAGLSGEFKRDETGRMTFTGTPTGRGTSACERLTLYRLEGF